MEVVLPAKEDTFLRHEIVSFFANSFVKYLKLVQRNRPKKILFSTVENINESVDIYLVLLPELFISLSKC